MNLKTTPLILTLAFLTVIANGAENIEGAFGLKLGEVFTPTSPALTIPGLNPGFEFTPKSPNSMFSKYLVCITPASHRIYEIVAIANYPDQQTRDKGAKKIMSIVMPKYERQPHYGYTVSQGNRAIEVRGPAELAVAEYRCILSYLDKNLRSVASDETLKAQQEELAKDADATGL